MSGIPRDFREDGTWRKMPGGPVGPHFGPLPHCKGAKGTGEPKGTVRSQIAQDARLIRIGLAGEDYPRSLDRVLLDNTIRQLPPDTQRTLATEHGG
jgi:hypothetical protein